MDFHKKQVFVFDAFGTLFKASEIGEELEQIAGAKTQSLTATWRRKQLEYTWLRNQMKRYAPFNEVTKEALGYAMRLHGLSDERIPALLLPIYDSPSLIGGAFDLLKKLKQEGKTVCILSNGTRTMLNSGVAKTGISELVDSIFSVDDIGVYKPDPAVYKMAVEALGRPIGELVFFSSNQWDVSGASIFGLDCAWVNQYGELREGLPFGEVEEVASLGGIF
ncbi:MAG TPA: haloacid dehalogenase type II [Bacteroidetes bacterium]|nr:haloacid dehalogenase type II [Bacteroidota bacterium]